MKYEAFHNELEKISVSPVVPLAGAVAGSDLMNIPIGKSGLSTYERTMDAELARVRKGSKKGDKKSQKKLYHALKARATTADAAESGGGSVAQVGIMGGGLLGSRLFGRSLMKGEQGQFTFGDDVDRLRKAIAPSAHVTHAPASISSAMHIPKGGILPRFARPFEEKMYQARGIPQDVIRQGLDHGTNIVPMFAGPHVGAHELGHHAFRQGRVGRFVAKTRMPLGIGAGIGSSLIASQADPDSVKAKYLAPALGAASVAPILGEEAAASIKALRGMRRAGYNKAALKTARGQLAKAFGTYGMFLGIPAIAGPIAMRAIRKRNIDKRTEKGIERHQVFKQQAKNQKQKLREM